MATKTTWGLLGPEKVATERRTRTLGLGAAVRTFNDLAVPGMGNVYFGKQLVLALLGVAAAEEVRKEGFKVSNIETANAVEAAACYLAFADTEWKSDRRLRGVTKMKGRVSGKGMPPFAEARKRSFYVTQPMRMSTSQPLLELGLVKAESDRFNAFSVAERGRNLIKLLCGDRSVYYSKDAFQRLCEWIKGEGKGDFSEMNIPLSPLKPLPYKVRDELCSYVVEGNDECSTRRRNVMKWMRSCEDNPRDGGNKPSCMDSDHWRDIKAGTKFFRVRDDALSLLDELEGYMESRSSTRLPLDELSFIDLAGCIASLHESAEIFLDMEHDPTPEEEARKFCKECISDNVIKSLVERDDRVLRISGDVVIPGPAFGANQTRGLDSDPEEDAETSAADENQEGAETGTLSRRIKNMWLFTRDLEGKWPRDLETSDEQ